MVSSLLCCVYFLFFCEKVPRSNNKDQQQYRATQRNQKLQPGPKGTQRPHLSVRDAGAPPPSLPRSRPDLESNGTSCEREVYDLQSSWTSALEEMSPPPLRRRTCKDPETTNMRRPIQRFARSTKAHQIEGSEST